MGFKMNNDLERIDFNVHNACHFYGCFLLTVVYGFFVGYGAFLLWEVLDGFKPWHYTFSYDHNKPKFWNFIRRELFYSDKFSLQDVLVWNLAGGLLGLFARYAFGV